MKYILIVLLGTVLYAETIDCTQVFETRKSELLREVEKIDEARKNKNDLFKTWRFWYGQRC